MITQFQLYEKIRTNIRNIKIGDFIIIRDMSELKNVSDIEFLNIVKNKVGKVVGDTETDSNLISLPNGHTNLTNVASEIPNLGQKYKIKEISPTREDDIVCDDTSPHFLEYHIYLHGLPIYQYFLPDQLTTNLKHPAFKKIHQQRFDL